MKEVSASTETALYHGTANELSGKMSLNYNNKGVGWNNFTLGNGIYLTDHLAAAKLFSHISLQNKLLRDERLGSLQRVDTAHDAGIGNVYQVHLSSTAKILDARQPLDPHQVRDYLKQVGAREDTIKYLSDNSLRDFNTVTDLLCNYPLANNQNTTEAFVKHLGCDGLRIQEDTWKTWDYYPKHLGLSVTAFKEAPTTVIVYNPDVIQSYKQIEVKEAQALNNPLTASLQQMASDYSRLTACTEFPRAKSIKL